MAEFYRRKKICQMCAGKSVDYKDVMIVSKYINEKGKITPTKTYDAWRSMIRRCYGNLDNCKSYKYVDVCEE